MKERPVLFSAPMVRALLDGAKTQTRRVCREQPFVNGFGFAGGEVLCHCDYLPPSTMMMRAKYKGETYLTSEAEGWQEECPCGVPGDRLWVRETFMHEPAEYEWTASVSIPCRPAFTIYRADVEGDSSGAGWKPSIHMPRALSRITLEVTDVRVERLQDISEADARAEGVGGSAIDDVLMMAEAMGQREPKPAACAFRTVWEDVAGAGSWDANPWVWAVTFRRVAAP